VGEGVAGERHDDFGGDGDAGGLDCHQENDRGISAGGDGADEEGEDFFGHAGVSIAGGSFAGLLGRYVQICQQYANMLIFIYAGLVTAVQG